MTDRGGKDKDSALDDSADEDTQLNLHLHLLPSQRSDDRHRDHCDYLLDAIDEQLDQLQPGKTLLRNTEEVSKFGPSEPGASDMDQSHDNSSQEPKDALSNSSNQQCKVKECKKDEYKWRMTNLLGSTETDYLEYHSDSNSAESVCTEDFIEKFKQGMVEPIASNRDNEEILSSNAQYSDGKQNEYLESQSLGLSVPLSETKIGDNFPLSTARREDILQQFKDELEEDLQAVLPTSDEDKITVGYINRRDSVESLGGTISRLSQANISEPSSHHSFEKLSSKVSHLSANHTEDHPKSLGSQEPSADTQFVAYTKSRNISRIDGQETNSDVQSTNTDAVRTKRSWEGTSNEPNFKLYSSEDERHKLYDTATEFSKRQTDNKSLENDEVENKAKNIRSSTNPESFGSYGEILEGSWKSKLDSSYEVTYPGHHALNEKNTERSDQMVSSKDRDLKVDSAGKPIRFNTSGLPGHMQKSDESLVQYTKPQSSLGTQCPLNLKNQTEDLTNMSSSVKEDHTSPYKHVAGIPLKSFDTVTVDSDLDSVTTERVRDHIRRAMGSRRGGSSPDHAQYQRYQEVQELTTERVILEESVAKLRRDVTIEEDRLSQKKVQYREADQSYHDILQQKEEAYQELESFRDLLEQTQKDVVKMESRVRESQMKTEDSRNELVVLEYKRNEYVKELQELELELDSIRQQHSITHNSQIANFQYEISSLTSERDELKVRVRYLEGSLTFMERQELERQLSYAKSELLSEQRAARAKIEKLQENLEECQNKLEEKMAECADFLERNNQLKSQLRELEKRKEIQIQNQAAEATEQKEVLNQQVTDLTCQTKEQNMRINSMEKIVSEKELEMLRLRDVISSLKADKEAQRMTVETLKEEQNKRVLELQVQHQQDQDVQLTKLREELQCQKQKEIQQFAENMEQVKTKALQDQADSLRKEMDEVAKSLEVKDKEIKKLKETLKSQKDSMKKLAIELRQEAREMMHNTLIREQKKWESDKRDALQIQRHTMEEERLHDMADLREALEQERRNSMAFEKKSADLQNIIQEHEIHNRTLQREKEEALDDLRAILKEEKQEEVKRIQLELAQDRERDVERLKLRLQQLEEEQHVLRAEKNEAIFREREALAQAERAERALARDISAACERIQSVPGRTASQSPSRNRHGSPTRLSTNQALQMLHGVSEETNQFIHELQQEVEAQKRTAIHVQREKERELQQQREQLQLEKEKALELLKERLIQEHIEEITNLQRDQLKDSNSADSRSLRQQLREKDNELRAIQRNMAKWKEETATKLARKFEEELNAELEKCKMHFLLERSLSRSKATDGHRYAEKIGSGSRRPSMQERREISHLRSSSTPSLNGAAVQHDFGALKILRHLQGRVRELRSDTRVSHAGSMEDLTMLRTDLGNSYREKPPLQRPSICERSLSQIQGTMRK
ncbi:uncharacterized protein O3C94_003672 [Discoglossus pictus]